MERNQPDYLAKLPRDRHGIAWVVGIGLVLAVTMAGAWQLYVGTVVGWENRFNRPAELASPAPLILPAPVIDPAQVGAREGPAPYDKCIDGTAFKRLAGGGWENVPGIRCQ